MQVASSPVHNHVDGEYRRYMTRFQRRFLETTKDGAEPLFTTNTAHLWQVYLASFSNAEQRQYHNCNACRHFIERFGGLVTIDKETGVTQSAIWKELDAPLEYQRAIGAMQDFVKQGKVTGVFLSSDKVWGTPTTGPWTHFAVTPVKAFKHSVLSAFQAMAEKAEDFKNITRALTEYRIPMLDQAVSLLNSEALYRSEKVLGQAQWLHDLQTARLHSRNKVNVVWREVALAPAGFCHPRSSMIGTLLDDLAAGMAFTDVAKRFKDKMHPLQYQRPSAAPKAGTILQAEKLVSQLGIERALERRYCRPDEIKALWRPSAIKSAGGMFSHLAPKKPDGLHVPMRTMTWVKFYNDVLSRSQINRIELLVPPNGPFSSLVTAVHDDAPPILQWDSPENRNPVSWYFYNMGSTASQFSLHSGDWRSLVAITLKPSMWHGGFEHQGKGVMFVIEGAADTHNGSLALFPEILKSELHGVRAVIEAHSRSRKLTDGPQTAGLMFSDQANWKLHLRVQGTTTADYMIDRWD